MGDSLREQTGHGSRNGSDSEDVENKESDSSSHKDSDTPSLEDTTEKEGKREQDKIAEHIHNEKSNVQGERIERRGIGLWSPTTLIILFVLSVLSAHYLCTLYIATLQGGVGQQAPPPTTSQADTISMPEVTHIPTVKKSNVDEGTKPSPPVYASLDLDEATLAILVAACNMTYLRKLEASQGSPPGAHFLAAMHTSMQVISQELTPGHVWTSTKDPPPSRFSPHVIMPDKDFTPFVTRQVVKEGTRLVFWGDVHGSFGSLMASLQWLTQGDRPCLSEDLVVTEGCRLLFLGDFVDRGQRSLQVLFALFLLKSVNGPKVLINRGNHEYFGLAQHYGLWYEIAQVRKYATANCNAKCMFARILRWFEFLPFALYIGSVQTSGNSAGVQVDFNQFSHGVYEFGYRPQKLLAAPVGNETDLLHEWIGPLMRKQVLKHLTDPTSPNPLFAQQLASTVAESASVGHMLSLSQPLTGPTNPVGLGLCWDDMVVREKNVTPPLIADSGRGLGWDISLLEHMFRFASTNDSVLRGVIRGHQHNDAFGPMLTRLIDGRGFVDAYGYGEGDKACPEAPPISREEGKSVQNTDEQEHFWVMTTISAAESNLDFPYASHGVMVVGGVFREWKIEHWWRPFVPSDSMWHVCVYRPHRAVTERR